MTCHRCQTVAFKFGIQNGFQRYRCKTCGRTFSDIPPSARPLDSMRIAPEKAFQVIQMLCEGVGIRACERLAGLNRRTVLSILETAGQKCARLLDSKIRDLEIESAQADELYSFVLCLEKNNQFKDPEIGDQYTFLGIDRKSKLILSYHTGKRDLQSAEAFMSDLRKRIKPNSQLKPVSATQRNWPTCVSPWP